jgi:RNA polymerase sigma-70 factor (ECF subfamily)
MPARDSRRPETGPEATLLLRAGRGEEVAFAELYDATVSRLHGLVLRVVRDPSQAEEVTQEVYLAVWEEAGRFDPSRGSARSWMCAIAHRRAVDRVRSSEASRRRDDTEHQLTTPLLEERGTEDLAGAAADARETRAALATLKPAHRKAIELAYFGGHTHVEVSALLGIPLGTAKSRIRDGLIALRDAVASTTSAHRGPAPARRMRIRVLT